MGELWEALYIEKLPINRKAAVMLMISNDSCAVPSPFRPLPPTAYPAAAGLIGTFLIKAKDPDQTGHGPRPDPGPWLGWARARRARARPGQGQAQARARPRPVARRQDIISPATKPFPIALRDEITMCEETPHSDVWGMYLA